MRRLFRSLIVLGIVLVVLVLAARWYLTSASVAHQAAEALSHLFGGPVRVAHADIGLRSSTLNGVQFYEEGAPGQPPWLTVASAHADLSLWDLVSGKDMPRHVALKGAKVTLRFDSNGHLLTRFPTGGHGTGSQAGSPLPVVDLEQSQITFRKEGGNEVVLDNVKASLRPEGAKLVLSGEGSNPRWGKLVLGGDVDTGGGAFAVDLKSAGTVHVTQQMMSDLPFVAPSVWQEVNAEGDTPVDVKLSYDPTAKQFHYRVELEPKNTRVSVPAAGLKARKAAGKLLIEDAVVKLRGVKGEAYHGALALDGDLDFRGPASRLDFTRVEGHGLDVRDLPPSWGLPVDLEGRLDVAGTVDITLGKGDISTTGNAKAEIRNARLAGQPVDGPIEIQLAPEGAPLQVGSPAAPGGEQAEAPRVPPPPRKQRLTYLTVKLKLKDADVAQMVEKLKLKLPFAVAGRLDFQGTAALPTSSPRDAKDYRFVGAATLRSAVIADIHLQKVAADARYQDGVLRLDKLYGVAPGATEPADRAGPGTFRGNLVAQVAPAGDLTANLDVNRLPLGQAAKELGVKKEVEGDITGSASVKISLAKLKKDKEWDGGGRITVKSARAYGWTLTDAGADVKLQGQTLTVANVHGTLEGTAITGAGALTLKEPYPYHATVGLPKADLSAVNRLAEQLRPGVTVSGRADLTAKVSGTLEPFRLESSGWADVTALKVDKLTLQEIKLKWDSDLERLKIKELQANLYGGKVTGGAELPLKGNAPGRVDLTLKDIDVGALLKEADVGLPIEGRAEGVVKGTLGPAPPGKERPVDVTLDLKAPRLKVEGIEADALQGKVQYAGEDITYKFEAKTLGGTLEVEGKVPRTAPPPGKEAGEGKLQVRGLHLERLGPAFGARRARWPLGGRADAHVDFRFQGPQRTPVGSGLLTITGLTWDHVAWLGRVQAWLEMDHDRLLVHDLNASLAQGSMRGRLSLSWKHARQNWYQLTLNRVDADTLLAAWPELRGRIQGPLDASVRGTFARGIVGHGTVVLSRGKIEGVRVAEVRTPFSAFYSPRQHRGRLEVQAASGTVAQGRVTGDATYDWGGLQQLQGKLNFANVDLNNLTHSGAEGAYLGGGKLTGTLTFSGPGLSSLSALNAVLDARLAQAQVQQNPVLRALSPFVGFSPSSNFQSGQVRAHLSNGVIRLDRLSLQGGPGDLYAKGTVTTQGRLNLDVHASARWAGLSAKRIPLPGATIPARMLGQLTNSLTRNLIHVHVIGTYRAPTVQIMPVRMLQEDVVRFFLRR